MFYRMGFSVISLLTHPFTGITRSEMRLESQGVLLTTSRETDWNVGIAGCTIPQNSVGFEWRDPTASGWRVCPCSVCVSRVDVACVTLRQPQFNQHVPRKTHSSNVVEVGTDFGVPVSTTVRVRHKVRWMMYLGKAGLKRLCLNETHSYVAICM